MNNGIDVITQKITLDAEAQAAQIRDSAEKQAESIRAAKAEQVDRIERENAAKIERMKSAASERAESSAASSQRNELLSVKGSIVKEAFAAAEKRLLELDEEKYCEFLCSLLCSALDELLRSESMLAEYDPDEEYVPVDRVLIVLGAGDARFADALAGRAEKKLAESGKTVAVSTGAQAGKRGFRIVYGQVEIECSARSVIEDAEARMSPEVYGILFPDGGK